MPAAFRFCLGHARVLFCTVASAGSFLVRTSDVCATSAVVDEAAQLPEAELSILLARWPTLAQLVLVSSVTAAGHSCPSREDTCT